MHLGYIVSRFPSTTETFVAREMRAIEALGASIELFALIRQDHVVVHPEAEPFLPRLRTAPLRERATLLAQWYWIRRRPRAYLSAWWDATRGNWRSPGFLVRAWIVLPMAARFAREAEQERLDHVHAHWATHPALAAYVIHRLTGISFSFTAHAHDIYVDRSMLAEKIRAAAFVSVISSFNRDYLGTHFGSGALAKATVVRCGIDPEHFTPNPLTPPRNDRFTIACVASLQRYKGHVVLIDALAALRDRGVVFTCVLVGEGEERPNIEEQIERLNLSDSIVLLGARTSDEVLSILTTADVVALPSVVLADGKMEGIPVALMEALGCEIPVVASRISGIPELVIDGETGLLVEPGDHIALADAIERLYRDPELCNRLGAAGRSRVVAEFDERTNARTLFGLFESALQT